MRNGGNGAPRKPWEPHKGEQGKKKHGNSRKVSHEEVRAALDKFRREGGVITRLPPQEEKHIQPMGMRWAMWDIDPDDARFLTPLMME